MLALFLILAALISPNRTDEHSERYTVEWLTEEASLIFVGTRVERSVTRSESGGWITNERFQLDRVLEGPVFEGDTTTMIGLVREMPPESWWTDERPRLIFAETVRRPEWNGKAKYSVIDRDRVSFSFVVGADVSWADHWLFTPEFKPLRKYSELEGRARRHLAWQDHLRNEHEVVDFQVIHLHPRVIDLGDGQGQIVVDYVVTDTASEHLLWPCPHDQKRSAIVRWPAARHRAPARIQPLDPDITFRRLEDRQRAFSNRRYTWFSVPEKLRGWSYSVNEGGEPRAVPAAVTVSGHVYLAVAECETLAVEAAGWTLAGEGTDLDFRYNDRGNTKMKVYSRHMDAGSTVEFPAAIWTGSVILIPPAWL